MKDNHFKEGLHYYYNQSGKMVLTATYLSQRGYCCGNGCFHCPYNYENVPNKKQKLLLQGQKNNLKQ